MTVPPAIAAHRPDGQYAFNLGHPNLYEVLYLVPRLLNAKLCIEIGTENGNGAAHIGQAMQQTGGVLHTVDIELRDTARNKIQALGLEGQVKFHLMDGKVFLQKIRRPDPPPEFPFGLVDFAFEDSAHTYDHTLECLRLLHPLMRHGGVIMVDDITMTDVARAVREFLKSHAYTSLMSECGSGYAFLIKEA